VITVANSRAAVLVLVIPGQILGPAVIRVILDATELGQDMTVGSTLALLLAKVPLRVSWAFAVSLVVLPSVMRVLRALASSRLDISN